MNNWQPAPHVGQATHIESARAQAEVEAAVLSAKRWPRDEDTAERKMQSTCRRAVVAEKAFWRFPRAGEQLTGPTIHLARTLAGIWGNIQYGVVELDRDTIRHQSQILAVAWELESNARATATFLAPHVRDTKSGQKALVDLRDIYENNANMGARRLREMIFNVLPDWYTEQAQDICRATLEKSDKPVEQQRADMVKAFAPLGVTAEMLAAKIGKPVDEMLPGDLAFLRIIYKSINRGEATVKAEFADKIEATRLRSADRTGAPVTAGELTGGEQVTKGRIGPDGPTNQGPAEPVSTAEAQPVAGAYTTAGENEPERSDQAPATGRPEDESGPASEGAKTTIHAKLTAAGYGGRDKPSIARRYRIFEILADRPAVQSTNDLSGDDANVIIAALMAAEADGGSAGVAAYLDGLLRDDEQGEPGGS
jgi:hypothetical protein